jgi:predicted kinase
MDLTKFQNLDIVLVCGLPGSGKSHFARTFFLKSGRKRVNRKEIRRHLFEMTTFGQKWTEAEFAGNDEFLVKHVERKIIEHFLQNHQKLLLDNTNISAESRKLYLTIAHQTAKSIGAIFLNTPVGQCLQRNRGRDDAVPESVIAQLQAERELPELSEGYREVLVIETY